MAQHDAKDQLPGLTSVFDALLQMNSAIQSSIETICTVIRAADEANQKPWQRVAKHAVAENNSGEESSTENSCCDDDDDYEDYYDDDDYEDTDTVERQEEDSARRRVAELMAERQKREAAHRREAAKPTEQVLADESNDWTKYPRTNRQILEMLFQRYRYADAAWILRRKYEIDYMLNHLIDVRQTGADPQAGWLHSIIEELSADPIPRDDYGRVHPDKMRGVYEVLNRPLG